MARQPVTLPPTNGAEPPATPPRPLLDDAQIERLATAIENAAADIAGALDRLTAAIRETRPPVVQAQLAPSRAEER